MFPSVVLPTSLEALRYIGNTGNRSKASTPEQNLPPQVVVEPLKSRKKYQVKLDHVKSQVKMENRNYIFEKI